MKDKREVEIIAGRVGSDASILNGDGFRVARISAGIFDIILDPDFHLICAVAQGGSTGYVPTVIQATYSAGGSFRVGINFTQNQTAADTSFSFVAVGYRV